MSARVPAALFAFLVLTVAVGSLATAGTPVPAAIGPASADQTTATPSDTIPPGTTSITVQLRADGDATWTIKTRIDASTEEDRDAFREMANRYESGQMTAPWLDKVRAAASAAEESTGRPMNITNARTSADINDTTVSLRFTWTNFAREDGDHMVVDDSFNTTRGTWLDGLTENQEFTIELPEGHAVVSAPKGAIVQNAQVHWQGPEQFEPGYMRIEYSGDGSPLTAGPDPGDRNGLIWGGFFVLGLGIVAVGAYVFSRRRGDLPTPTRRDGDGPDSPAAGVVSPDPSSDTDGQTATAGTVEPTAEEPDDIDEELLSDEERVERLLESNGGRMKQANIVRETGWSNAKVSQLLSAMEDEGAIDKLRIGRENLISFPDEDVTDLSQD